MFDCPRRFGTIPYSDLDQFDAQFFRIPPKQADVLDPQNRMTLRVTYEAITDAGLTMGAQDISLLSLSVSLSLPVSPLHLISQMERERGRGEWI